MTDPRMGDAGTDRAGGVGPTGASGTGLDEWLAAADAAACARIRAVRPTTHRGPSRVLPSVVIGSAVLLGTGVAGAWVSSQMPTTPPRLRLVQTTDRAIGPGSAAAFLAVEAHALDRVAAALARDDLAVKAIGRTSSIAWSRTAALAAKAQSTAAPPGATAATPAGLASPSAAATVAPAPAPLPAIPTLAPLPSISVPAVPSVHATTGATVVVP